MKILHVLDHSIPLHSGYTFRTRAILRNQHALGIETAHVTSSKQGNISTVSETCDGLAFHRTAPLASWINKLPVINQLAIIPQLKRRLLEVIAEEQPDIIHAHSPALNGMAALQAARATGIPFVYEVRAFWEDAAVNLGRCEENNLRYRLTRTMESHVLKHADAITCICQGLRQDIIERGIAADKVTVVPNAVDMSQFQVIDRRDEALAEALDLSGKKVLGFIGSFYEYEGLDLLVEAFAEVVTQLPETHLLLVGGGPQEAYLQALAEQLGIARQVRFTGRVPHEDVGRYYSLIDLLVYPRKSMRLTELVTPLKPLEAMAQKRPFLASDVGGHHELIKDGDTGFLFQADNAAHLSTRLLELLQSDEQRRSTLEAGYAYVSQERNWRQCVNNYLPVYSSLVPTAPLARTAATDPASEP